MDNAVPIDFETTGMESVAVLKRAEFLQSQARKVLSDLNLVERWGNVGRVAAVGSSQFGVMASYNLDFEIYVDDPQIEVGFEVIQGMAQVPGVQQILYLNVLDTPDPGLYWRVDYRDAEGTMWDIDQWLVPNSHPYAGVAERLVESMRRVLTDEARRIILEIKTARPELPACRGIDIYKAVLRDGVRTKEEFEAWFRAHPPCLERIETWHP